MNMAKAMRHSGLFLRSGFNGHLAVPQLTELLQSLRGEHVGNITGATKHASTRKVWNVLSEGFQGQWPLSVNPKRVDHQVTRSVCVGVGVDKGVPVELQHNHMIEQ
jgi:hypothetical protein